jgi:hypothetical protein
MLTEFADPRLAPWQSFYVIVGSSGAALIGIQFVVIALIADRRKLITTAASISAFATPTVVHLGGALVVSAFMSAPWPSLLGASIALAICSFCGSEMPRSCCIALAGKRITSRNGKTGFGTRYCHVAATQPSPWEHSF